MSGIEGRVQVSAVTVAAGLHLARSRTRGQRGTLTKLFQQELDGSGACPLGLSAQPAAAGRLLGEAIGRGD